ncbi:calcineurin subunit B [Blyttiomyces helicus]|uniref:Calcineurin subunit B n=1 Tax=Blyttiomyces helicus TaxID=388810 RepID=A0A4P9W055_9FUNG|nr:calcineurin subunit B [Blyttiomyces helicus]|eukprot:RKO85489.1 calcineurin subunit B [Blyttiomyces helicus]
MGLESSRLQPEEIEEMRAISTFSEAQIKTLYRRFKHLDKDNTGSIAVDDMQGIPELAMNPLSRRIVAVFDADGRGEVSFRQFVAALSVFSRDAKREQKLSFAFKVYDVNNDGVISSSDLFIVLKQMVGSNLDDAQVQSLVERTILEADTIDNDGAISFGEFKRAMFNADLENALTIDI